MPSDYDATEFVDGDFQAHKASSAAATASNPFHRAPTREEVDSRLADNQQARAEKQRALEALQREQAALEETRRRQSEFHTGRQEMIQHLTRGLGLLEQAEFNARRDAEQMAKTLVDLRDALSKVQSIQEESWTEDKFEVELTRALTTLEHARMEWNAARLKIPVLSDSPQAATAVLPERPSEPLLLTQSFVHLCRLGLALTWPLVLVVLLFLAALTVLLLRR